MGKKLIILGADFSVNAINTSSTPITTYWSINKTLTGFSINNAATSVTDGGSYVATLTLLTDYTGGSVSVVMSGNDITSSAYNSTSKTITIANVTGNVTITAVATYSGSGSGSGTEEPETPSITTLTASDVTWVNDKYWNINNDAASSTNAAYAYTTNVNVSGYSQIKIENAPNHMAAFYNASGTKVGGLISDVADTSGSELENGLYTTSSTAAWHNIPSGATKATINAYDKDNVRTKETYWKVYLK